MPVDVKNTMKKIGLKIYIFITSIVLIPIMYIIIDVYYFLRHIGDRKNDNKSL